MTPPRTALLVTADLNLRDVCAKLFRELRWLVVTATTSHETLGLAQEFQWDVVVFDIRTADDLSSCRLLRDRLSNCGVPVVAIIPLATSYGVQYETTRCEFAAVVSAPFAATDLARVIQRVVRPEMPACRAVAR